ncbi:MAG: hypothetical protein ACT4O1_02215 [Gemmatimonadota bacterium]
MKRAAIVLTATLLSAAPLSAQSNCTSPSAGTPCSTASGTLLINITIGRAIQLALAPSSSSLTTPTPAHYDAGFAATTGPSATIRSNAAWTLAMSAAATTWTATDTGTQPARTNKPAGDLLWATSSGGPFTPLTTSAVTIASGGATAGMTAASLFYRTLYSWTLDTPGDYSLQVVFTITAP